MTNNAAIWRAIRLAPIHIAAANGNIRTVNKLLKEGTPVNSRDEFGLTPLMHAASGGHTHVVKRLLEAGARVNRNSLQTAANGRHRDTLKLLIQKANSTTVESFMRGYIYGNRGIKNFIRKYLLNRNIARAFIARNRGTLPNTIPMNAIIAAIRRSHAT